METPRVAVVTGGANNIGLEIVRRLAGDGMAVVSIDWDAAANASAEASLAPGRNIRFLTGDIGTPEGAQLGIDAAIAEFGRLDVSATTPHCTRSRALKSTRS